MRSTLAKARRVRRKLGLTFGGEALMRSTECADLGALAIPGSSPARDAEDSQVRANSAPRYFRGLPVLF